ncbi:hypothetical protein B0H67DRAFT_639164 [Lasiosphaeris hirsuta]|uniref:Uncharacterized protein n=1 Tax=Lasiosphaeris hirsuta TaxID=260670 RepID=A0AA40BAL3_9PEZI|nr:hypothetical protein B0H67DRAFT_639164 [Lasiosphaeris hirsuta]
MLKTLKVVMIQQTTFSGSAFSDTAMCAEHAKRSLRESGNTADPVLRKCHQSTQGERGDPRGVTAHPSSVEARTVSRKRRAPPELQGLSNLNGSARALASNTDGILSRDERTDVAFPLAIRRWTLSLSPSLATVDSERANNRTIAMERLEKVSIPLGDPAIWPHAPRSRALSEEVGEFFRLPQQFRKVPRPLVWMENQEHQRFDRSIH